MICVLPYQKQIYCKDNRHEAQTGDERSTLTALILTYWYIVCEVILAWRGVKDMLWPPLQIACKSYGCYACSAG